MKKCLLLAIMAVAFIMQSCGDNPKENTDLYRGPLANENDVEIGSEKGEYFCEFKWTDDYKHWEYDFDVDNPVGTDKAKAPWCLVPYGRTTYYKFYFTAKAGENHYACRDKDGVFYQMLNETVLPEISIDYEPDDRIMRCVKLEPNARMSVTASGTTQEYPDGTPDLPNFRDDRLYHVIEMGGLYSIEGHSNLKFVRQVALSVRLAFVDAGGDVKNNINNASNKNIMIDSLKNYMKKAGYTLKINFLYTADIDEANKSSNRYDYVVGVKYDQYKNNGGRMASSGGNVSIIKDDAYFFNSDPAEKARLLAALLYSKILWRDPLKNQNDLWLSYYTKNLSFSQPSKDWEEGRYSDDQQGSLLEYTSIIQNFKGE